MKTHTLSVPIGLDVTGAIKTSAFTVSTILLAVVLPAFIHSQWITGPIINAILMIVTVLAGTRAAMALALLPAPIALVSGLLPTVMAPMVPFIMLGNIALVAAFASLYDRSAAMAVVAGAVIKFVLIGGTALFLMDKLVSLAMQSTLITMMGLPQLVTALVGGVIAVSVLRIVK